MKQLLFVLGIATVSISLLGGQKETDEKKEKKNTNQKIVLSMGRKNRRKRTKSFVVNKTKREKKDRKRTKSLSRTSGKRVQQALNKQELKRVSFDEKTISKKNGRKRTKSYGVNKTKKNNEKKENTEEIITRLKKLMEEKEIDMKGKITTKKNKMIDKNKRQKK